MTNREALKTSITGSFKFKPEIDRLHEEFADHGVMVLEPSKGWLWTPTASYEPGEVRPLPAEVGMDALEIENRFLAAVAQSDFLYVYNSEGYIGSMGAFEIGWALARDIPVYTHEPVDALALAEGDMGMKALYEEKLVLASMADIVRIERSRREQS